MTLGGTSTDFQELTRSVSTETVGGKQRAPGEVAPRSQKIRF